MPNFYIWTWIRHVNEQWNYVAELLGSLKLRMALHYKTGHSLIKKSLKISTIKSLSHITNKQQLVQNILAFYQLYNRRHLRNTFEFLHILSVVPDEWVQQGICRSRSLVEHNDFAKNQILQWLRCRRWQSLTRIFIFLLDNSQRICLSKVISLKSPKMWQLSVMLLIC